MRNVKKYNYQLKTISKLILSPRDQQAYYLAVGDFELDQVQREYRGITPSDADAIKIIYPFYQYGSYPGYSPEKVQYYIPGSSIKGAISSGLSQTGMKFMIDDILVEKENVELNHLYKLQHATDANNKQGKLEVFFPNVAVEMLKAKSIHKGELFTDGDITAYFEEAHKKTVKKLEQFKKRIELALNLQLNEDSKKTLFDVMTNLNTLIETSGNANRYLLLIGGFKGLMMSREFNKQQFEQNADKSAVYIDQKSYMPYGLVYITLE